MSASFLTSLSEQEFKDFLKSALQEIIGENSKQTNSSISDILNIKEAAALLKLKITTIYEKTSKKIIPHFKRGNKLYFNKNDLVEWIKKGKVTTQTEIEGRATTYLLSGKETKRQKIKSMFNQKNKNNAKN